MKLRYKSLLVIGLLLGLVGLLHHLRTQQNRDKEATSPTLKVNEKEKVIINNQTHTVTVVTPTGTKVTEGSRHTVVTITKDNEIQVYSPQSGFIFEPGITQFHSDYFRVGVDVQWYYFRRWGLLTGGGIDVNHTSRTFDFYQAVGYTLPFETFSNTTLFVGYSMNRQVVPGVRLKF